MNMKEKLAEALYEAIKSDKWTYVSGPNLSDLKVDGPSIDCFKLIDAVLDAMREPSEEVAEAGRVPDWDKGGYKGPGEVWRDMIDAIRSGK